MNNQVINYSLKRMTSGFCSTALIACLVLGGSNAFAQSAYKLSDLGVLPSKEESVPAAINDQGLITGTSSAEASGEAAFRYNPNNSAPMEDIGHSTRGRISRGFGINNLGTVVGDLVVPGTSVNDTPIRHAALFSNGSSAISERCKRRPSAVRMISTASTKWSVFPAPQWIVRKVVRSSGANSRE